MPIDFSVTPSDFFLFIENLLGRDNSNLGEFCCVCGRSLAGITHFGAGNGDGNRFACQPCYTSIEKKAK